MQNLKFYCSGKIEREKRPQGFKYRVYEKSQEKFFWDSHGNLQNLRPINLSNLWRKHS